MTAGDPLRTRRESTTSVAAELDAAGFTAATEIGRGGFGVVYRCTQQALDRTVAVKLLTGETDEDNRARFVREQRAMGRLTGHPNIVPVLEAGVTDGGRLYLVTPYYPSGSLEHRIRRHGPLPAADALQLGVKIAGALESAHRLGVVHRDVKPGNILLTDYGEPALTDFGIAHISGGFRTAEGTVTGSPAYTAPEVLEGDTPTPAADVYGLGATLFSALTGHAAFERGTGEKIVTQFLRITSQALPDLRENGIPGDITDLVEAAMSRDPRARPSAAAFGEDARRVQRRDAERAAVLLGAAHGLAPAGSQVTTVYGNMARYHEECEEQARHTLGDRGYDAARRRGLAMNMDAAVAYTLGAPATEAPTGSAAVTLTKRERQVADLVAQGLSNKQIAAKLVISQRTAQSHVEHILTKLGFSSRAQIAAWITENARD